MERTFPQKVKPVPSCEVEEGVMVSQVRQTPQEIKRRVRTSAAVIGLALSVGTYGLPLPNQSDEASAAEPVTSEPTASTPPTEFDIASASQKAEATELTQNSLSVRTIEHTVQEGQTLWQLAQFYRVNAATVASANGISVGAVLHVGQVLKVPASDGVGARAQAADAAGNQPEYYGPIDSAKAIGVDSIAASSAQSNAALDAMRQKQESLRLSLAQLKSSRQATSVEPAQPALEVAALATSETETTYRVLRGDTLGAIAKAHNVSLRELVAANSLSNPNVLSVDQRLVIPQSSTEVPLATPTVAPVMIASASPDQLTLPRKVANSRTKLDELQQTTLAQSIATPSRSTNEVRGVAILPNQSGQVIAVEQTLPTVSLTHSSMTSTAIGGSAEVATTSFMGNQQPTSVEPSSSSVQASYVENLRLEIVKLRAKYQDSESQIQSAPALMTKVAAASLNVAAPTKTESSSEVAEAAPEPTRYTRALQSQIRQLQAARQLNKQAETQAASALVPAQSQLKPQSKPQIVATASIGSQSYEPLIPSSVGQMVSPDLPPLGSVDAYLPGNTGKFNGYIWPAKGVLTSGYGYRWGRMHKGIDIAAPVGTPVFAAATGVVITAGWNSGGYGNMVEIQHPDGSVTLYAHNSRIVVREGQEVNQGQQIADMGSTGYSTGPHSHFEVHLPGRGAVNPIAFLPKGQA